MIDEIDRRLLLAIQRNSDRSVHELGQEVGLSASACHRRIKALEEDGYVLAYRAWLNAEKLGFTMQFFIEVSLANQSEEAFTAFEQAVTAVPEILECHLMAGQFDYILRVVVRDHADFEQLHRRLVAKLPGVSQVHSNMSIRTVKTRTGLPLGRY
ncbi:MAG: Lrp/AsnC family transcriptional regulator [Hyphomicrobiaceae bacterium]|nr:Lrp/AsnC family transcriptional regulator [Hyphomicrobiaceae bacterium]